MEGGNVCTPWQMRPGKVDNSCMLGDGLGVRWGRGGAASVHGLSIGRGNGYASKGVMLVLHKARVLHENFNGRIFFQEKPGVFMKHDKVSTPTVADITNLYSYQQYSWPCIEIVPTKLGMRLLGRLQVDWFLVQRGTRMQAAHLKRHSLRFEHDNDLSFVVLALLYSLKTAAAFVVATGQMHALDQTPLSSEYNCTHFQFGPHYETRRADRPHSAAHLDLVLFLQQLACHTLARCRRLSTSETGSQPDIQAFPAGLYRRRRNGAKISKGLGERHASALRPKIFAKNAHAID